MSKTRDDIVSSIKRAAALSNRTYLTYSRYREITGIPMSAVLKHFDSWREACAFCDVNSGTNGSENITPSFSKGKDHAIEQLRNAAVVLNCKSLSKRAFDSCCLGIKASTVARLFGGWELALAAAGLERHEHHKVNIDISELADEFLSSCRELGRIPTVHQIERRSTHCKNSFTRKYGSFLNFKREAIYELIKRPNCLSDHEQEVLKNHLDELPKKLTSESITDRGTQPHHKGRILGFRAFAFTPTYENEVVSLFSVVAEELGFEILCQRPAFPDCEARRLVNRRRQRYERCLIEFELRSRDYLDHKHPLTGCDLIVCWEHNWKDCPIEVLELCSKIRCLPGWK